MTPTNDNSNPQQGAPFREASPTRRVFKVPPTRKDERKLFVGGLPGNITEIEFRNFFEQYGSLVDAVVMFDRETRRSRGFGFVSFEDPAVCRKLLMMGNEGADPENAMHLVGRIEMQGKICEVKAATPKEGARRRDDTKRMEQQYGDNQYAEYPHEMHHFPGYQPVMHHNIYYLQPHSIPPPYGVPYMEYPVYPTIEPNVVNPQIGYSSPFPPMMGIPVMPYGVPMIHAPTPNSEGAQ